MSAPIAYRWDGEAMKPVPYFADEAKRTFQVGSMYRLAEVHDRSTNSHNHYFAALTEAWRNLRDDAAERFPSVDHFRKYLLIRTGYSHSRSIACGSPEEAQKVAAFVRPLDEFAVVSVGGTVVTVFTAMSQSYRDMDKQEFAASKEAVLELAASMIGTDCKTLKENAGAAA